MRSLPNAHQFKPRQPSEWDIPLLPTCVSSWWDQEPEELDWLVPGVMLKNEVTLFAGATKLGKCLGKGTPVLMFDGTVRPVEQIKSGELLMGPDSKPRAVLSLSSGIGPLYRVTPNKGDPYVVNQNHILSLKLTPKSAQRLFPLPVNITVTQYLSLSRSKKHRLKGWRAPVEWPERAVNIPPYLLGLWLGDGTEGTPEFTSADEEIVSGSKGHPNAFSEALRRYGAFDKKQIPQDYLINSRAVRLELLAGLLDSDWFLADQKKYRQNYEITQKRSDLSEQIVFLARSLGFFVSKKISYKRSQESELLPYHRMVIGGDISDIPVRLDYKKAPPKSSCVKHRDASLTGIRVEPIGEGEYYGFELDGDHLFMLGDFTVTHNTMLVQQLMTAAALGRDWIGQEIKRFRSFGFFAEDREQILKIRQGRINHYYDVDYPDLEQEIWLVSRDQLRGQTILCNFERFTSRPIMTPRWNQLSAILKDEGVRVVFIDTSARTFGGNENDRSQVTAYIEQLTALAESIGGAVVLNAHPSKPGPKGGSFYSGSTAWESSVRITVSLERPDTYSIETGEDEDARMFKVMGSNYGGRNPPRKIRWDNGVFVSEDVAPRAPLTQMERIAIDSRILDGIRRSMVDGAKIPADELAAGSAPKRARRVPEFQKVPYGELVASVQRLIADGRLVRVTLDGRVFIRPSEMLLPGETP